MSGRAVFGGLALLLIVVFPVTAMPVEKNLTLDSGTGMLAGTLSTPENPTAAILILAGSGPTDRNGNSLPALNGNTYRLLAEGLAAHGITSLRTDKRGIGESRAALASEADLRIGTYADDARLWVAELRKQTDQHCVWLLGHSEGALVAEFTVQNTNGICGLIMAAGAGRNLGDILLNQTQNAPPELRQKIVEIIVTLRQGHMVADVPPPLMALFRPSVQPYWISEINLDPAALLKTIRLPVMILQGDTDIQVSVDNARLLAAAAPDAKLMILPGVNHLLKIAPSDRMQNIATYKDPNLPLAPGIVDAVTNFVHEHGS